MNEDSDGQRDDTVDDVSEADQQFLRALLAADVAEPPPSSVTVESILAAARAGNRTQQAAGGRTEPATDRLQAVGRAPAQPPEMSSPDFPRGTREVLTPPSAFPVSSDDELAARRRRRRGGLLAAAAVAAVLAIGIPVALRSSNDATTSSAGSAAGMAATSPDSARGPAAAAPGAGQAESGQSDTAAAGAATDSGAASAAGPAASSSAAASAAAPTSGSDSSPSASATAGSAASGSAAASAQSAVTTGSRSGSGPASGQADANTSQGPPAAVGSAGSENGVPDGNCRWPDLPAAVDQLAEKTLGSVVDAHRSLTTTCRGARVAGAEFPAVGSLRGVVTVQVVHAPTGDCAAVGCRKIGDGVYAGVDGQTRIVWTYRGGREVMVRESAGLTVNQAQLVAFARGVGDLAG